MIRLFGSASCRRSCATALVLILLLVGSGARAINIGSLALFASQHRQRLITTFKTAASRLLVRAFMAAKVRRTRQITP